MTTMKVKVSEATNRQLDWLVGVAEGYEMSLYGVDPSIRAWEKGLGVQAPWNPTRYWNQMGPIIERESLSVIRCDDEYGMDRQGFTTNKRIPVWGASIGQQSSNTIYGSQGDNWGSAYSIDEDVITYGPTPLSAAARCYVVSKLGEEVEVPKELV